MTLAWHQLKAEQLTFWRSREAAIFVLFPPLLFVLLALALGGGTEDGRPVDSYLVSGLIGYAVANTARRPRDHTRDPARVGILKRLRSTLPGSLYIATVLASNLILVALQAVSVIALGVLLFGADLPRRRPVVRSRVLLGAVSFAGLGLQAALIRSAEAVAAVVNVIVLPMSFLSGAFGETDNLPRVLELVASVLP